MKRIDCLTPSRRFVLAGLGAVAIPSLAWAKGATIKVWKTPTCGCCGAWVEHLQQAGFDVEATDIDQDTLDQVKNRLGVPTVLHSCHTAEVGGYVVEGHVPAADIKLLLNYSPEITGVAVPGMPVGSPGMEMGDEVEPYATYAFDSTGPTAIFARHGGA
ncbi:MAG: DUF411 domain-containing protein [Paracoccaceae bacterium]|nr:DUF411 domain-containing protein [Paracoccaceae bacterium]